MVTVLNNKFDRAVKFSLTKCAYTQSLSKNQFFGNIKFNGAVSFKHNFIANAQAVPVKFYATNVFTVSFSNSLS